MSTTIGPRTATRTRETRETRIEVTVDLDGTGATVDEVARRINLVDAPVAGLDWLHAQRGRVVLDVDLAPRAAVGVAEVAHGEDVDVADRAADLVGLARQVVRERAAPAGERTGPGLGDGAVRFVDAGRFDRGDGSGAVLLDERRDAEPH